MSEALVWARNRRKGFGYAALYLGVVGVVLGFFPVTGLLGVELGALGIAAGLFGIGWLRGDDAHSIDKAVVAAGIAASVAAAVLGIFSTVESVKAYSVYSGLQDFASELESSF